MAETIEINIPLRIQSQQARQELRNFSQEAQRASSLVSPSPAPSLVSPSEPRTEAQRGDLISMFGNNAEVQNALRDSTLSAADRMKKAGDISEKLAKDLELYTKSLKQFSDAEKTQYVDGGQIKQNGSSGQDAPSARDRGVEKTNDILQRMFNASLVNSLVGIGNTISNGHLAYTQQMAQGNVVDARLSRNDTIASTITGIGQVATMINPMIGLLISAGGSIFQWWNNINKEHKAYADVYESKLGTLSRVGSSFNGDSVKDRSAAYNSNKDLADWVHLLDYGKDTGMNDEEFSSLALSLNRHGIANLDRAGSLAQTAAKFSRFTNGDSSMANTYADFMGTMARYGSSHPENDLRRAYASAQATGMQKGQFGEFMQGLQRVIEDGIANGYTKSTKEVSDTMMMFSKLSHGSEYWKGQQGFNRLGTMNQSLAGITALSSTTDLIAYQAINGLGENSKKNILGTNRNGSYASNEEYGAENDVLNNFLIAEKGLDNKTFPAIAQMIKNTYGQDKNDNMLEKVMAVKNLTGLNYTGAKQVYDMMYSDGGFVDVESKIKDLKNAGQANNETLLQNTMLKITQYTTQLGKPFWEQNLGVLKDYVKDIRDHLLRTSSEATEQKHEVLSALSNMGNIAFLHDINNDYNIAQRNYSSLKNAVNSLNPTNDKTLIENLNAWQNSNLRSEADKQRVANILNQSSLAKNAGETSAQYAKRVLDTIKEQWNDSRFAPNANASNVATVSGGSITDTDLTAPITAESLDIAKTNMLKVLAARAAAKGMNLDNDEISQYRDAIESLNYEDYNSTDTTKKRRIESYVHWDRAARMAKPQEQDGEAGKITEDEGKTVLNKLYQDFRLETDLVSQLVTPLQMLTDEIIRLRVEGVTAQTTFSYS